MAVEDFSEMAGLDTMEPKVEPHTRTVVQEVQAVDLTARQTVVLEVEAADIKIAQDMEVQAEVTLVVAEVPLTAVKGTSATTRVTSACTSIS